MKKLIIFTLMFLFLFSYVSAVRVDYSPNDKGIKDMKAVVKDTILWDLIAIGEQGTMELKSHKSPTEIIEVGTGWQVTMIYDTNFGQAHKNILGNVYFYDLKTGEEVEREYKFVYWGTEERERDTYETICEVNSTSKNETENCYSQVNGTETYTYDGWLDYNSKDLPKGQIKLGLMTNVLYKDKIDGVWEVQGKKIEKHAGWTSELSVGLVSYYKLDETSGTTAIDSVRGFNGTISNGITINQAGKINKAIKGDNTANARITVPHNNLLNGGVELSLGLWRKGNTSSLEDLFLKGTDTNTTRNYFLRIDRGKIWFAFHDGTGYKEFITTNIVTSNNTWEFIVATYNDANNNVSIYVNGALVQSFTTTSSLVSNTLPLQLCGDVVGYTCTSFIDEMFIYNRTLSLSEITQLYNSGNGITYEDVSPELIINLTSPIDYYNSSNQTIDFSANLTDEGELGIQNVSLVINDTIYDTNTSGLIGIYNFSETLSDGFYEWYIEAYDDTDEYYTSETRYFTIDTTPFIEFVSPTPANASNLSVPYIPVNVTVTEDYFENVTFYFYKGGVLNESITFTDGTRFYNKTGCTCDNWEINATVCTTTGKCNSTETRSLIIDILAPEIEILSPVTSYNYLESNQTIDLNVSITDASDNLDSCWYKYPNESYEIYYNFFSSPFENVIIDTYSYIIAKVTPGSIFQPTTTYELGYCNNVSFSDVGSFLYLRCNDDEPSIIVSTENLGRNVNIYGYNLTSFNCSENQTFNYIPDQNTLTVYANDTFGNEGSESVSWDYNILELSRNYNTNVYETGREEYEINLKSNDSLTGIKILYDSMEIILSKINNTLWRGSQNIFTSLIGTNDIIFEFNYSGETFQSYVSNQTVYELNYGFNPTYTDSLNITIRDEETNDIINDTTLYYNNIAWIGNGEVTKQFTESSLEDGEYMIGFSPSTILELNTNNHFWIDAPGYQLRNYYFEDITLYNDSLQNYTFYLLDSISGLVTRYKIVSPISGNAIEDVKVTSYKESVPKILTEIAMTDATGVATMWQNADYFYEMTFEKEGCDTKVSKIRPSTSDIQIIEMNCEGDLPEELTDEPWEFPEDQKDFRISFTPNTQILYEDLNNFTGHVKDKDCELGDVVFNIKDENDTILNTTSFNNTCINDLNLTYNTTGVKTITLELIVEKDDVTYIFDKVFQIIGSTQLSGIPNLWDVIMMMPDYDELGFSTSTRFFLGLIILFLLLSYLSTIEGFKSEGIGTLIFIPFYVLILSVLGWFSLPVTSFTLINKYGLFIITLITVGGVLAIKTNN